MFSYASALDFGHYSRLEQLQRRLWYFSYLKYPISSVYHLLMNSSSSILSSERDTLVATRPCHGCVRCQPTLIEQYHLSQQTDTNRSTSFFSRFYRSNRVQNTSATAVVLPPTENVDCGVDYSIDTRQHPVQLRVRLTNDSQVFQCEINDQLTRFNYNDETRSKHIEHVHSLRFYPNTELIDRHLLINHDKFESIQNDDVQTSTTIEYRIEFTDETLKFIEINPNLLIEQQSTLKTTNYELEEQTLESKGIFLLSSRAHVPTNSL
jgi:hypothetical protein